MPVHFPMLPLHGSGVILQAGPLVQKLPVFLPGILPEALELGIRACESGVRARFREGLLVLLLELFTLRGSPPAHPKTATFAKGTGYRELSVCALNTGGQTGTTTKKSAKTTMTMTTTTTKATTTNPTTTKTTTTTRVNIKTFAIVCSGSVL